MRVFLIALLVLAGIVPARAADLKLLTAGAFKSVALEIVAEFEKRTGHKVTIDNDTAGGLSSASRPASISTWSSCRRWCWGRSSAASSSKAAPSRWPASASASRSRRARPKPDISSVDASRRRCWRRARSPISIPHRAARAASISPSCSRRWALPQQLKPKTVLVKGGAGRREGGERRGRDRPAAGERAYGRAGRGAGRPDPARPAELHDLFRRGLHRLAQPRGRRRADAGAGRSEEPAAAEEEGAGRPLSSLLGARHSSGAHVLRIRKDAPLEWRAPSRSVKRSADLQVRSCS